MLRLQLVWIAVLVVGGCSDDGTAGTGGTGSASGASTNDEGTSMATGSGTTPGSMSSDPSEGSGVTMGETSSDSGSTANATSEATSSGSGSSGSSGSGSGSSSTGGEPEFMPCSINGGMDCPEGLECFPSKCCFGVGFCLPPTDDMCGGIAGLTCMNATDSCVTDLCVNDGFGACVSSDFFDAVCEEQPKCWNECQN